MYYCVYKNKCHFVKSNNVTKVIVVSGPKASLYGADLGILLLYDGRQLILPPLYHVVHNLQQTSVGMHG